MVNLKWAQFGTECWEGFKRKEKILCAKWGDKGMNIPSLPELVTKSYGMVV